MLYLANSYEKTCQNKGMRFRKTSKNLHANDIHFHVFVVNYVLRLGVKDNRLRMFFNCACVGQLLLIDIGKSILFKNSVWKIQ